MSEFGNGGKLVEARLGARLIIVIILCRKGPSENAADKTS